MPVIPSPAPANCPVCDQQMRKDLEGSGRSPTPKVFWFCMNIDCRDGKRNKTFQGG